jgi:hypothetical protein
MIKHVFGLGLIFVPHSILHAKRRPRLRLLHRGYPARSRPKSVKPSLLSTTLQTGTIGRTIVVGWERRARNVIGTASDVDRPTTARPHSSWTRWNSTTTVSTAEFRAPWEL